MPAVSAQAVAIDLPEEHAGAARAAIEICNMVLGDGHCHVASESSPAVTWHAIVRWEAAESLHADVEIRRSNQHGPLLSLRHVEFTENDSLDQRYRALGLLVVSHVLAEASKQRNSSPVVDRPTPTPSTPSRDQADWGIDWLGFVGGGLRSGSPRFGTFVRLWADPFASSWHPFLRLGWATSSDRADVDWYDASLGILLTLTPPSVPWFAELRLEGTAQSIRFEASERGLGTDSDRLPRFGGRLGAEGGWRIDGSSALLLGVEGSLLKPGYRVEVVGQPVGREPAPNWGVLFGVRISP